MSSPTTPRAPAASNTTTNILFIILLIALFPAFFHSLVQAPLNLLSWFDPIGLSTPATATTTSTTPVVTAATMWTQKQFALPSRSRGSYLITDHIMKEVPEIRSYKVGILHLFMQHTSCALSLNENWDEDVRADMSDALDRIAPEEGPKGEALYRHDAEGLDDMPAHIKSALVGASVTVPIKDGRLVSLFISLSSYLTKQAAPSLSPFLPHFPNELALFTVTGAQNNPSLTHLEQGNGYMAGYLVP